MRAARFEVSVELLREAFHMPMSSTVTGAWMSADGRTVYFEARDPTLPDATEPHDTLPTVTKEQFRWDWNVLS